MIKLNYLDDHRPVLDDSATAATHLLIAGFPGASIDIRNFTTTMSRTIDTRPCEPLRGGDADWGEQDDGRGLRRALMPVSLRLAVNPDLAPEGDR